MDNKVTLVIDKTVTRLAGYPYGQLVYNEQVDGKLDFSKTAYIEFPQEIVRSASSFVQGFFEKIISIVGIDGIGTQVVLLCNDSLKESIMKNL